MMRMGNFTVFEIFNLELQNPSLSVDFSPAIFELIHLPTAKIEQLRQCRYFLSRNLKNQTDNLQEAIIISMLLIQDQMKNMLMQRNKPVPVQLNKFATTSGPKSRPQTTFEDWRCNRCSQFYSIVTVQFHRMTICREFLWAGIRICGIKLQLAGSELSSGWSNGALEWLWSWHPHFRGCSL